MEIKEEQLDDTVQTTTRVSRVKKSKKRKKSTRGAKSSNSLPIELMMFFFSAVFAALLFTITMMLEALIGGYPILMHFTQWSPYSYYQLLMCIWAGLSVGGVMLCWRIAGRKSLWISIGVCVLLSFGCMFFSAMSRGESYRHYQGKGGITAATVNWLGNDWLPRTEELRSDTIRFRERYSERYSFFNRTYGSRSFLMGLHVTLYENWLMLLSMAGIMMSLMLFGRAKWGRQRFIPLVILWLCGLILIFSRLWFPVLEPWFFGLDKPEMIEVFVIEEDASGQTTAMYFDWQEEYVSEIFRGKSWLENTSYVTMVGLSYTRFAMVFVICFCAIYGIRYWLRQTPSRWYEAEVKQALKTEVRAEKVKATQSVTNESDKVRT